MVNVSSLDSLILGRTLPPARSLQRIASGDPAPATNARANDCCEVSEMATYLSKLSALPQVRQDLVNSVREQIAAGTYDTPERLDAALNVLLSDSGN